MAWATGEKNGAARLTVADVEMIRVSYATGRTTLGRLARKLGVSRGAIWRAVKGQTWRHVWMPPPRDAGEPTPAPA